MWVNTIQQRLWQAGHMTYGGAEASRGHGARLQQDRGNTEASQLISALFRAPSGPTHGFWGEQSWRWWQCRVIGVIYQGHLSRHHKWKLRYSWEGKSCWVFLLTPQTCSVPSNGSHLPGAQYKHLQSSQTQNVESIERRLGQSCPATLTLLLNPGSLVSTSLSWRLTL